MNTIEKIRAEIERLIVKHELEYTTAGYVMNELLSFLDTLEEKSEKPMNLDLEIAIENSGKDVIRQAHYHNKIFDIPQTHFEDVQLMDIFKAGVYKGYELGRSEKPNNHLEGLDEVAEKLIHPLLSMSTDTVWKNAPETREFGIACIKVGAEWQKDKDSRDMYMSDNRHFQKVYELGRKDEREQMMKEAVEGEVKDFRFIKEIDYSCAKIEFTHNPKLADGQKVKIIIIKEDEK